MNFAPLLVVGLFARLVIFIAAIQPTWARGFCHEAVYHQNYPWILITDLERRNNLWFIEFQFIQIASHRNSSYFVTVQFPNLLLGQFADCVDKNVNCKVWADGGYCAGDYKVYMSENCKKSCFCSSLEGNYAPIPWWFMHHGWTMIYLQG